MKFDFFYHLMNPLLISSVSIEFKTYLRMIPGVLPDLPEYREVWNASSFSLSFSKTVYKVKSIFIEMRFLTVKPIDILCLLPPFFQIFTQSLGEKIQTD